MRDTCDCNSKTLIAKPVKYSKDDKFASYRRKAKIDEYKKSDLL